MSLKEEIKAFRQADGLVSPKRNPEPDSTGNGLLYSSLYYILLVRRGEARFIDEAIDFVETIQACEVKNYPGLLNRSRTKTAEQIGPDDYIGVMAACHRFHMNLAPFASNIVLRGMATRFFCFHWIYNNVEPGKFTSSSWFGRFLGLPGHFLECSGVQPGFFQCLGWALNLNFFWNVRGGFILRQLQYLCPPQGFICEISRLIFEWRVWREYRTADSMGKAMREALASELGAEHPITRYWQ